MKRTNICIYTDKVDSMVQTLTSLIKFNYGQDRQEYKILRNPLFTFYVVSKIIEFSSCIDILVIDKKMEEKEINKLSDDMGLTKILYVYDEI